MKLIDKIITISQLKKMSSKMFGGIVKAVIDIKKEIMVVDGALHSDEEKHLLDSGSNQNDLWGINLYPDEKDEDFIEYDSIINVRPRLNNLSREVEDKLIRKKIIFIVNKLVKK